MSSPQNLRMVSAVFLHPLDAVRAMDHLHDAGYPRLEMNLVMAENGLTSDGAGAALRDAEALPEQPVSTLGMGIGGAIGTAVGATLAALSAVGLTLVVPPLGLVIAGPLVAALVGGGAGAAAGALAGGFGGLPDPKTPTYAEALQAGGVILGVTPHDRPGEVAAIEKSFQEFNGQHIHHGH